MAAMRRIVVMGLAAVLVAGCGESGGPADGAGNNAATAQGPAGPGEVPVEQLLEQANAAFQANQLFDPPDANAMALFLQVAERKGAAADPNARRRLMDSVTASDPQARAKLALNDLMPFGLTRVEQALRAGELADAERVLLMLERAQPDSSPVEKLRASYDKAFASWKASLRSTDFDTLPPLVSKTMPTYPPRAERRGVEGWVHVSFAIQPDGSVADVKVIAAEPERTFDSAAVQAVKAWKFQQPNRVINAQRRIEFDLDGEA